MLEKKDNELIEEIIKGRNTKGFNILVRRYYKQIYYYLYRMTGNKEIAEDLTQETFLKAFKALPNYEERMRFKAWLYKIATNLVSNYLTREKQTILPISETESYSVDPEKEIIGDEEIKLLRSSLDKLPPRQKEALILAKYEGLKGEEIAKILNLKPNAVYALIYRGLENLSLYFKNVK